MLLFQVKRRNGIEKQLIKEVDDLLEQLDMNEKRNVMPDKLSGGQKRRLCLAIALIGNSSVSYSFLIHELKDCE